MTKYAQYSGVKRKCCLYDDEDDDYRLSFDGFVRAISYIMDNNIIKSLDYIYEGYTIDADPKGFGRIISSEDYVFVGYFGYKKKSKVYNFKLYTSE